MSNQASLGDISGNSDSMSSEESSQEWEKEKLGNVAVYQNGNSFSKSQWSEEGYPIIRIQNLTGQQEEYNHFNGDLDEKYKVEEGDILLAWSGTIDLFQWGGEDAALNQHIYRVDTEDGINDIFFQLKLEEVIPRLIALSHGSTMKHVRKADLVNLDVEIPSDIDEQRRIASVLYNVDQAIQKTEEIIEQTQRVKKGLMQDLFTQGYYSHKDFEEHQIFGKYPTDWKLSSIGELAESIPGGGTPKKSNDDYWGGDIPWASVKDFNGPRLSETKDYITEKGLEESSTNLIPENSIITSTRMGLGRAFINDVEMSINQDMKAIITTDEVKTEYLLFWIFNISDYIESIGRGTTVKGLSLTALRSIDVPLPPKEEQEKIVESLKEFYAEKKALEEEKEQLLRLKKGLMQDLLTGSVRTGEDVRVLDEVVEVEG